MFRKITLSNNLRVITAPMQGTNTVTILMLCDTGSDNEPVGKGGISHFLEHMFFKGTENRPTPQIINQEFDSMGGFWNAYTSHEVTGYFAKVGKIHFDRVLDILTDIYTGALIKAEEVERERPVILEERKMRLDDPSSHIWFIWEELLYGDQHAGWHPIGTEEAIRGISAKDFHDYFYSQYTAQNTVAIIAGNFDESMAIAKIGELFRNVRSSEPLSRASFLEEQQNPAAKLHYKEIDQTNLILGLRGFGIDDADRYPLDLLAVVLGGSSSSRIFDTVRERLSLAYAVYSDNSMYSNRGFLYTYAGVAHANLEKTIEAILLEYKKMTLAPPAESELRRAKDLIKGKLSIRLESSDAMAHFIGEEEVMTREPLTVDEVFAKIDSVTQADIHRAAKRLIQQDRLNLAVIGPHQSEARLRDLLIL